MVFVYLGVCMRQAVAPANRGAGTTMRSVMELRVDCAQQDSDLRAKLQSQNQCPGSARWRVLVGFYAAEHAWRKSIRPQWSRAAQTQPWEEVLRVGLQLAAKHAQHNAVYVSTAAQGSSPLLRELQSFAVAKKPNVVARQTRFWKLVCSSALMPALSHSLLALTDSWTAAGCAAGSAAAGSAAGSAAASAAAS